MAFYLVYGIILGSTNIRPGAVTYDTHIKWHAGKRRPFSALVENILTHVALEIHKGVYTSNS